jgi:hypothetical protein
MKLVLSQQGEVMVTEEVVVTTAEAAQVGAVQVAEVEDNQTYLI